MDVYRVYQNDCGDKCFYLNNKLHNRNGAAKITAGGDKFWYIKGKLHRIDGPAVIWANGHKEWWLNGACY